MASKTYSKGAKRRAKKAMPELASAPRRKTRGRKRMAEIKADPEAERTVLEARARQSGLQPKELTEMRNPALGEAAGRAFYAIRHPEQAKRLWSVYTAFTAAEAHYAKHYLGLRLHANTAKLEMMVERIETRADDKPDFRTEEERSRDASNNWMRWRGLIMHLANPDQRVIFDVAYGRAEPMDAGQITTTGAHFVAAIERLADVVDRANGTR